MRDDSFGEELGPFPTPIVDHQVIKLECEPAILGGTWVNLNRVPV